MRSTIRKRLQHNLPMASVICVLVMCSTGYPAPFRLDLKGQRSLYCQEVDLNDKTIRCIQNDDRWIEIPRVSVLQIVDVEEIPPARITRPPDPSPSSNPDLAGPRLNTLPPILARQAEELLNEINEIYRQSGPLDDNQRQTLTRKALELTEIFILSRDWYQARSWLDRAKAWGLSDDLYAYYRARMLRLQFRVAEARETLQPYLSGNPGIPFLLLAADIALANDQPDEALTYLERAQQDDYQEDLAEQIAKLRVKADRMSRYRVHQTRHFHLRYTDKISDDLEKALVGLLENALTRVSHWLDIPPREPIPVRIYTRTDYQTLLKTPDWSGGAYDGIVHVPVQGYRGQPDELTRSIQHELCHALLTYETRALAPAWFQEGIAQHCEFLDDASTPVMEFRRLTHQYGIPPAVLMETSSFSKFRGPQALLLYRTAYMWTAHLFDRYRVSGIKRFIGEMNEGHPWKVAFEMAFGRDFKILYEAWRNR